MRVAWGIMTPAASGGAGPRFDFPLIAGHLGETPLFLGGQGLGAASVEFPGELEFEIAAVIAGFFVRCRL